MYLYKSVDDLESEINRLNEKIARTRREFLMFYEITRLMRSSLRLEELLHIILTGITANNGLGFNRAALFMFDIENMRVKGTYAIGPAEPHEAEEVWKWFEETDVDLYGIISEYRNGERVGAKAPILKLVEGIEFPLSIKAGILYEVFLRQCTLHIKSNEEVLLKNDPLHELFLFNEAVLVPLWVKNQIIGVIFVDNIITHKAIESSDKEILEMFASQASLAIENSYLYEDTLLKAHTDTLTSLWNYGFFSYRYDELFDSAVRFETNLSLIMLDVDNFKQYNDKYGHIDGDRALIAVAHIIKDQFRKDDVVCRYGGEEFVVILPGAEKAEAISIAERVRVCVANYSNLSRQVTVSIGISSLEYGQGDKKALLEEADSNLYRAKRSGKNKVVY